MSQPNDTQSVDTGTDNAVVDTTPNTEPVDTGQDVESKWKAKVDRKEALIVKLQKEAADRVTKDKAKADAEALARGDHEKVIERLTGELTAANEKGNQFDEFKADIAKVKEAEFGELYKQLAEDKQAILDKMKGSPWGIMIDVAKSYLSDTLMRDKLPAVFPNGRPTNTGPLYSDMQ